MGQKTRIEFTVSFEPYGKEGIFPAGSSILECARQSDIALQNICGGTGACGRCLIKVVEGSLTELNEAEKRLIASDKVSQGYRLACQYRLTSDCKIFIPPQSLSTLQRAQTEAIEVTVRAEPVVRAFPLSLIPPSFQDARADLERLKKALIEQHHINNLSVELNMLRTISDKLRQCKWSVTAVIGENQLINLLPYANRLTGIAVDIGTTKIAVYLVDLITGQTIAVRGFLNPQVAYGDNIVSRMVATLDSPTAVVKMQTLVSDSINAAVAEMCSGLNLSLADVVDAVLVGNTAIHHLFLRLPVGQLARAPFVLTVSAALDCNAEELGLKLAPGANAHLLPNIGGYVGADHVAMILASGIYRKRGTALGIDIGTNTEICLVKDGKMSSVSCASGPAFEGAHIKHGMRTASGAIEHIRINDQKITYQVIDGTSPKGICGSGIIDTVAQLVLAGVVDQSGRMGSYSMIREVGGEVEFVLVAEKDGLPEITFTQKDVREVQLAKGAIRAGISVLLKENNVRQQDIEKVIIAGAFGTYMDISSAISIGMLPDLPISRFSQIGNAAGMGAKMALISVKKRRMAQAIARKVHYIDLATYPQFNRIFAESLSLEKSK